MDACLRSLFEGGRALFDSPGARMDGTGAASGGGDNLVGGFIVEVFVGGIEGWDGDVDDFHFADGAVAAAGFN